MPTVSVVYPRREGATFDFDYYSSRHLPLLAQRWRDAGLLDARALRGVSTPDGSASPYLAMAFLRFGSAEAMKAAMGGPHAAEIIGDIANFTNVQPQVQINEELS